MKVALVHDWLNGMRGGERVLEAFCKMFPQADLYTLLYEPGSVSPGIENRTIHTSFLQRTPFARRHYRYFLPFLPKVIESFRLCGYDLVISSSHCVAKGVPLNGCGTGSGKRPIHICYCHSPMRYIYHQFEDYFGERSLGASWMVKKAARLFRSYLVQWDFESSQRVDYFLANSQNVQTHIQKYYGRDAKVIYPPVDTDFFTPAPSVPREGGYYLVVSALVPYKRVDLAIEACRKLKAPLKIAGTGPEGGRLKILAQGLDVEFKGAMPAEAIRELYRGCRTLLYPQEEDFGISAVEAMACGKPVVALRKGGALETVLEGVNGLFFKEQNPDALVGAMQKSAEIPWSAQKIRATALKFNQDSFEQSILAFLDEVLYNRRLLLEDVTHI